MKTPHPVVAGCQARLHARALLRARRVRKTPVHMLRRWMFRNAAGWRAKIERLEDRLWAERDLHEATKRSLERAYGDRDRIGDAWAFAQDLWAEREERLGHALGWAVAAAIGFGIGFLGLSAFLVLR